MAEGLKILAFGDSLTAGMYRQKDFMVLHHPYTINLHIKLQSRLPNSSITIVNRGVSGEQVLTTMPDRLEKHLNEAEVNGTRYGWVLVMGGINDIGSGARAEAVMTGLERMYERISRHKARLLSMTTMSLSASDKPFYASAEEERQKLNRMIKHWILTGSTIKDENVRPVLVDMDQLIKYTNTTTLFCPDGLHLSPEGYDTMGTEIFNGLSPFL